MILLVFISLVSCKVCRLDGLDFRTFAESGNTLILVGLLACAVVACARKFRKVRLCVSSNDTLVVSENYLIRCLGNDVLRHYRSLSAAAGSVNYECRYAISGGVSSETFDDLDSLGYGGSEVLDTHGEVADVDVVRTYSVLNKDLNKVSHDVLAVVYSTKKYGLVAERDTCVSEHSACSH